MSDGLRTRLRQLFNIRSGEGRLVGLLLVHSALVGCARIFTRASAYALFLARFDAQALAYVYAAMGLVVTLFFILYLRLSRLPMARVASLLLPLLGFRLGLGLTAAPWLTFALPMWYEVLFTLTNLEFWNLAGRLLTVRQGKRLFGLVTAGEQAAVLLGGLLVPLLVARIAKADLLTLAASDPLIRGTSLWALSRLDGDGLGDRLSALGHDVDRQVACLTQWLAMAGHEEERMLTTVEKVLALKKVDLFAATPDETLAAAAGLWRRCA